MRCSVGERCEGARLLRDHAHLPLHAAQEVERGQRFGNDEQKEQAEPGPEASAEQDRALDRHYHPMCSP
jgi:hypothetical protein